MLSNAGAVYCLCVLHILLSFPPAVTCAEQHHTGRSYHSNYHTVNTGRPAIKGAQTSPVNTSSADSIKSTSRNNPSTHWGIYPDSKPAITRGTSGRTLRGAKAATAPSFAPKPDRSHGRRHSSVAAQQVHSRACHPGCTKHGNCNSETGQCECPFGLTGPTCAQLAFPACRLVNITLQQAETLGVDLLTTCAEEMNANCECYRQCWRHYCPSPHRMTDCRTWRQDAERCFTYNQLPPAQQVSVQPEPGWTNVTYYNDINNVETISRADFEHHGMGGQVVALAHCRGSCNGRGLCTHHVEDDLHGGREESYRCLCIPGFEGDACEAPLDRICLGGCSGRGRCVRGFCHCQPPYYGAGCLKGEQQQQQQQRQQHGSSSSRLRVYMYDLPWHVAFQDGYMPMWEEHDAIYTAFQHFTRYLAADKSVLTSDPSEASLYFIPALAYYYSGNTGDPSLHMMDVIRYIRQAHPYWNATNGADHFYLTLNDRGACVLASSHPELWAPIKLVHFGATTSDIVRDLGFKKLKDNNASHAGYGCFLPGRDIVLAPYHDALVEKGTATYETQKGREMFEHERPILLAFAGGIRYNEEEYSGGVRQRLHTVFKFNRTSLPKAAESAQWPAEKDEILIHDGFSEWHDQWMKAAKFCLAPYGHGWGIRLSVVVAEGCVPVIIQDHIFQPYEDILPYNEFSLRLPASDIPRIREVLAAVAPEEWRRLHEGLRQWWKAFVWEVHEGGRAYELALASLRRRAAARVAGLAVDDR